MQNVDKSNIRNFNDISIRGPIESRYCQENQSGKSSKIERGISEEGEKSVQSNTVDRGPKVVRSKSEGNDRGFEDKIVQLREKAVNIGENCLRSDEIIPREDSGYGKEKPQMGKYCIGLQEENQSTGKHRLSSTTNYYRPVKHNHSLESTSINLPEEIGLGPEINTHCSTGREESEPSASSFQGESRFPCKTNIIQDVSRRRGIEIEGGIRLWSHEGQRRLDNSARENSREVNPLEEGGAYSKRRNREYSPCQETSQRDNSTHIFQGSCAEWKTIVTNVSGSVCSENEKGHSVGRETVLVPPTERQLQSGRRNSQYDPKNQTQRQGSDLPLRFNEEDSRRESGNTTIKSICYLTNIVSNSAQEGRLSLISEAIDPQHDRVSGGKKGELSAAGHQQNCSAILEGVFQGASSSSDTRPTNPYSRISTIESSRNGKIKIPEQINAEKMVVQHSERQNSLPAGSNGDGQNQLLKDHIHNVESPIATHTCYICNKTIQLRNLQQHLKSGIHDRNLQASKDRHSIADIGPIQLESENATSLIYDKSLLLKIFNRSDITTLKSIPKNLRRNIAMATTTLYRNSNSNVLHIQPHVELLIFPKIVLANMTSLESKSISNKKRRKVQTKYTKDRLDKWLLGGDVRDSLILSVLKSPLATYIRHPQSPANNMKRCLKLVTQQGQYSKAVQALSSEGIVEPSTDTTTKLQEKHPLGQLPTPIVLSGVESIQIHMEDITQALRSFPKDTACGRSGLRVSHLMETLYLGTNLDTELLTHVNYLVQGKAPLELAAFYASASLIALKKKDSSIRPIAVGEIIRRLTSKICLRKVTAKAIKYLAPYQLGIGVPNAIETILHGLNSLIRGDTVDVHAIFLLLDFENAFNMIGREFFFQEAFRLFPEISHWVQFTYGCAALLFTGADVVLSYIGVQQGDPLGPLLFCLVLQLLLLRVNDKFKGTPTPAYLDDATVGPLRDVVTARSALDFVKLEGPIYGLYLNLIKTLAFQPHGLLESTTLSFPDVKVCSSLGTELLGGALSLHDSYFTESAFKKVDKAITSLSLIMTINSVQIKLLLLRLSCGMRKLNYLWRLYDPATLNLPAAKMQSALFLALRSIVVSDGPHFGELQFLFSSLPTSLGGLGVSLPDHLLTFAYMASQIQTMIAQNNLFRSLSVELPPAVLELSHKFYAIFPEQSSTSLSLIIMPHNKKQNQLASWFYTELRRSLLERFSLEYKDEPDFHENLITLQSNSESLAHQWLDALPNEGLGQTMTNTSFATMVKMRLCIPVHKAGLCKNCGKMATASGYHAYLCGGLFNHRHVRHEIASEGVVQVLRSGGFNPVKNAKVCCLGSNNEALRPADILSDGDRIGSQVCNDITVVSNMCASFSKPYTVGKAALEADKKKNIKHKEACEKAGFGFQAFATDTSGVLSPSSYLYLCRIATSYAAIANRPYPYALSLCLRRVSFAIQKGLAYQLTSSPSFIPTITEDVFDLS